MTYLIEHALSPRPPKIEVIGKRNGHVQHQVEFEDPFIQEYYKDVLINKMLVGAALVQDTVPSRMRWFRQSLKIPDFQIMYNVFIVSDIIKDIIERHDRDIHQFIPIDFVSKSGVIVGRRYWFIVCNNVDSINFDLTEHTLTSSGLPYIPGGANLVIKKCVPEKFNVWHDRRSHFRYLCSDKLGAELQNFNFLLMQKPLTHWLDA